LQECVSDLQSYKHAGTAGYHRLHQCAQPTDCGPAHRASSTRESLPAPHRTTACYGCGGPDRARTAADRQANRDRRGRRPLVGAALDDCWSAALAAIGREALGPAEFGGVRFFQRRSRAHRSRHKTPRIFIYRRWRGRYIVAGEEGLRAIDPGGIEIFASDLTSFRNALTEENRTLKRALTDPRLVSGIGNAYSDEILHAARLSPITLTQKLRPDEWEKLFAATRETLGLWTERLRVEAETGFPEKVTAFRKEMAAHGRYGKPCPRCGEKIQRIRYADNETNYCARCQTGGKVLADRSLSRLLRSDWPRTLEELEALKRPR